MSDDLLDDELRDRLHRGIGPGPAPAPNWPDLAARLAPARRRRRQRRVVAVAATIVVLAVSALVVVGQRDGSERVRTTPLGPGVVVPSSIPKASASTTGSAAGPPSLAVRVLAQAVVPGAGVMVAGTDGSVWVAVADQGQVVHLGRTGQILGRVTLPSTPGTPGSGLAQDVAAGYPIWLASGEGSIWALSFGSGGLSRIDPATGRIAGTVAIMAYLDAGQANGRAEVERVSAGLGHVWVTVCCDHDAPNQRLLQIDPTTLGIQATSAPLPGDGESETPVAGPAGLFVTGEGFDTVAQVDPTTLTVMRLISVPGGAGPVAIGGDVSSVGGWSTATSSGTGQFAIDPTNGTSRRLTAWPTPVQQVAAASGSSRSLWARGPSGPVLYLGDGRLFVVPDSTGEGIIAAAPDGSLWFADGDRLARVVPTSS